MIMCEAKTVSSDMDGIELFLQQTSDVSNMKNTLLSFNRNDPNAARKAIQNITVLRVYHQMSRIVRYTAIMDKLEDKLYQSLENAIDLMDPDDMSTWHTLISVQNKLQENMIQSHKLLEPYLNLESLNFVDMNSPEETVDSDAMVLDRDSRERLRNSAQEVLQALQLPGSNTEEKDNENEKNDKEQPQSEST